MGEGDIRLNIRRANAGDFLAVAALDRCAWQRNRHPEFIPDGEHVWRIWCDHALTWVACHGGDVVGAILAFPCSGRGACYCLHKIMVDDACRGQGIGSRLMEALLVELDRGGFDAFLTVDPANPQALRLYERWGFTERRFEPGFYREGEDRLVLTRRAQRE